MPSPSSTAFHVRLRQNQRPALLRALSPRLKNSQADHNHLGFSLPLAGRKRRTHGCVLCLFLSLSAHALTATTSLRAPPPPPPHRARLCGTD
eukprot:3555037-Pleurochrysis_carterae.AAC.1